MSSFKITELVSSKPWEKDGEVKQVYYTFKAEGQPKPLNLGRHPNAPAPKVGDIITADPQGEDNHGNVKLREARKGGGGGGGFRVSPEQLRSENMRSCLHAAAGVVVALAAAGHLPEGPFKTEHVDTIALRWYGLVKRAGEGS